MNKPLRPREPETINCETCFSEIPLDESKSVEAEEYVLHFCGIECYAQWKERAEEEVQAEDRI